MAAEMAEETMDGLFRGVGVALLTLFHDDGSLDAPATAELADRLVDLGVQAVVVAGTTGEAAALSAPERIDLLRAVHARVAGRVPIVVGTGAPSTGEAVGFTMDAVAYGADVVLALSPPGVEDPRAYYEAVREAAGSAPLLAYHYPSVSMPGIRVEMLDSLPVDGIKDSSGDRDRLAAELAAWSRPTYTGTAALLSYAGPLGCRGAILGLANAEPERCLQAFTGDEDAEASLAASDAEAHRQFPKGLKELVARRFGVNTTTRVAESVA